MNRVCVVCLPRTGSQLCVKLIEEHTHAYDLGEFFEGWDNSIYNLLPNNNIIREKFISNYSVPFSINKNYNTRLKLLQLTSKEQPLNLRLFLMDHYNKDILKEIIDSLHDNNFSFLSLKRDIAEQLLSYAIAISYQIKLKKNIFSINSVANDPINIDLSKISSILIKIHESIMSYDNNIMNLFGDKKITNINYETLNDDLQLIYGKHKYEGEKTVKTSHVDLIQNIDEVRNFFIKHLNISI